MIKQHNSVRHYEQRVTFTTGVIFLEDANKHKGQTPCQNQIFIVSWKQTEELLSKSQQLQIRH